MTSPSDPDRSAVVPPTAAGFCGNCGTPLAVNAHFCHRCGTPFGQGGPTPRADALLVSAGGTSTFATLLPWGVAFVALLALVANFAGKNFGTKGSSVDVSATAAPANAAPANDAASPTDPSAGSGEAPFAAAAPTGSSAATAASGASTRGGMPNIANMSPSERAVRLYNRIMAYAEAGKADSVGFFAPMAMASHEMLTAPTADERYHYGKIAEVTNQPAVAKAQADTMLAAQQGNLLGLLLAARAARMIKDSKAERTYDLLLLKVVDRELATKNVDYEQHRAEIDRAVAEAKNLKP